MVKLVFNSIYKGNVGFRMIKIVVLRLGLKWEDVKFKREIIEKLEEGKGILGYKRIGLDIVSELKVI